VKNDWAERIVAARRRRRRPFTSLEDFARDTALPRRALILLADADAFRSIGLDRRAALWAVRRLPDDVPLPLSAAWLKPRTGPMLSAAWLPVFHLSVTAADQVMNTLPRVALVPLTDEVQVAPTDAAVIAASKAASKVWMLS